MFKSVSQSNIFGKEYQIHLLPAGEGFAMATKLSKYAAPALEDGDLSIINLTAVILSQIDDKDVMEIVKRLMRNVMVDGQEVNFDEYYMANYGELVAALGYIMKENFQSFFSPDVLEHLVKLGE